MQFITKAYKYRELLKAAHENNRENICSIKILLVTDWSSQFFEQALSSVCKLGGLNCEITFIINEDLELSMMSLDKSVEYDFLVIVPEYQVLRKRLFHGSDTGIEINRMQRICDSAENITNNVVIANYIYEANECFGRDEHYTSCAKKINFYLCNRSIEDEKITCMDLFGLVSIYGQNHVINKGQYYNSKCAFNFDFLAEMARRLYNLIAYRSGCRIKCIVLDFDDTLYGGTLVEDGVDSVILGGIGQGESYTDLQMWLQERKREGILLAGCTKNDECLLQKLFDTNSQMILKKDDFVALCANWKDKYKNIIDISEKLNIYMDSIMFLDDQIFERNAMREMLPDVYVPELSDYPENRVLQLENMGVFFGEENVLKQNRTNLIKDESIRAEEVSHFCSFEDYLSSLKMTMVVEPINANNIQRVSELSMRSNRFNVRTQRYTISDLKAFDGNENIISYCFSLSDRIGEYGLIGVIIIRVINNETCFIENLFMSCRVLNRGVEDFMMNTLVEELSKKNYKIIVGEYLPTAKNGMMSSFYEKYGFKGSQENMILKIEEYSKKDNFIVR